MGIGISTGVDPSVSNMGYLTVALDPEVRRRPDYLPKSGAMETATIKMDPLGKVTVFLCTTPQGQGHETIISQIVADEIGLTPEDVTVVDECDTAKNIWSISSGTYSSRFASVGTSAVAAAARKLRAKINRIAAHLLGIGIEDVQLEKGNFQRRGQQIDRSGCHMWQEPRTGTLAACPREWNPACMSRRRSALRERSLRTNRTASIRRTPTASWRISAKSRSTPTQAR